MCCECHGMGVWMSLGSQIILEVEVFGEEAAECIPQHLLLSPWYPAPDFRWALDYLEERTSFQ